MKTIKKIIFPLIALSLFSCQTSVDNETVSTEVKEEILNFSLNYSVIVPGNQISYNHMWEGTDSKNKFGPNFSENSRLYTYLLDYKDTEKYYFVYVNSKYTNNLKDKFSSYSESNEIIKNDCKFSSDDNVIDGKYILMANNENIDDFVITSSNKVDSDYEKDGYTLALCLKSKEVTILENVSSKAAINKTIPLYEREILSYDSDNKRFSVQNDLNLFSSAFANSGKMLEVYPKSFEDLSCLYASSMGFQNKDYFRTVRAKIDSKGVILPSKISGYDLLDSETELPTTVEDVYQNHKKEFSDALLEKIDSSSSYEYSYFDLDKVLSIIK